jgi:hypothetical protein
LWQFELRVEMLENYITLQVQKKGHNIVESEILHDFVPIISSEAQLERMKKLFSQDFERLRNTESPMSSPDMPSYSSPEKSSNGHGLKFERVVLPPAATRTLDLTTGDDEDMEVEKPKPLTVEEALQRMSAREVCAVMKTLTNDVQVAVLRSLFDEIVK